jgi:prepilin-type N-terminal cleavage/methylation domain-containing protein
MATSYLLELLYVTVASVSGIDPAIYLAAVERTVPSFELMTAATRRHQPTSGEFVMRTRKGFTLIELLIVVVIIGILAAIAIPKFANTKDKAYVAQMKSDLRNMATYEEQYAADNGGAYFGGTATMASPLQGFTPSQNVTVVVTNVAGPPPSWSATATHSQSAKTCDMTNGVITCA